MCSEARMDPSRRVRALASHLLPLGVAGEAVPSLISQTDNVKVEQIGRVVVVTMVMTKTLNALSGAMKKDIANAVLNADADPSVGCIVLTGSGKAFAAGADIKEMDKMTFQEVTMGDFVKTFEPLSKVRIPLIAAVNGFAFGGGCEIAVMCDIIIASDKAVFGQPEIKLGVIPGGGGTQRLIRSIGKSKAMALILSGRNMSAEEAEKAGLAAAVVKHEELMPYSMKLAEEISNMGRLALMAAKETVGAAYELTLKTGIDFEKNAFYSLFATEDKKEGMDAFVQKRKAAFRHK
uniref:Enoyl-CoA hydratase/carnithine racemase n=1 Tax=Karlodinium veneficum TaxID=407301 RepID=A3E3X9_KARVE|nr:enoyl-CoA hydratase/carnithine racemase [Karlodinium veneficum]